jgi:HK97 family phage portal protein
MNARGLMARTLRTVLRAVEGEYRPGPYNLPFSGGWLPNGAALNWWQQGENIVPYSTRSAVVEACVSAYSQTTAMCPGDHWRMNRKGGKERVTNSALSRILRHPNAYQTISDFMLNAVRQLYLDGNAYALALRNDRFEITELHLMDSRLSFPQVATDGSVFYRLYGNSVIEREIPGPLVVPQRDVLHLRLHVDRTRRYPFPLWGITPLLSTVGDIDFYNSILNQQIQFYLNQARPSAVLTTDLVLDKDQVQFLRDRWDEQSQGINQGKTPILTGGLKVQPWGAAPKDSDIAEILKISETHIALAFRIPLPILGLPGQSFGTTEALMQFWIATGLGFCLNHIEEAFGLLFQLKGQPDEYVGFDTAALLRSAFKDRIDSLARAVQGGIFSPNEARASEGYDAVKFGEEPRVQQQVVPLSAASAIPAAPGPGAPPGSPGAAGLHAPFGAKPEASSDNSDNSDGSDSSVESSSTSTTKSIPDLRRKPDHRYDVQRETRNLLSAAERINRNIT